MHARRRFLLFGFLAGAALGFGAGCQRAAVTNAQAVERMRAANPNATTCGLSMFAELAVGLVWAVPGGLLGLAAGAGCKRWSAKANPH